MEDEYEVPTDFADNEDCITAGHCICYYSSKGVCCACEAVNDGL